MVGVTSGDVSFDLSTVFSTVANAIPEHWGEAICAVVVPRAGSDPSAEDLIAYVRSGWRRSSVPNTWCSSMRCP